MCLDCINKLNSCYLHKTDSKWKYNDVNTIASKNPMLFWINNKFIQNNANKCNMVLKL